MMELFGSRSPVTSSPDLWVTIEFYGGLAVAGLLAGTVLMVFAAVLPNSARLLPATIIIIGLVVGAYFAIDSILHNTTWLNALWNRSKALGETRHQTLQHSIEVASQLAPNLRDIQLQIQGLRHRQEELASKFLERSDASSAEIKWQVAEKAATLQSQIQTLREELIRETQKPKPLDISFPEHRSGEEISVLFSFSDEIDRSSPAMGSWRRLGYIAPHQRSLVQPALGELVSMRAALEISFLLERILDPTLEQTLYNRPPASARTFFWLCYALFQNPGLREGWSNAMESARRSGSESAIEFFTEALRDIRKHW
jgi:hypothetical protein